MRHDIVGIGLAASAARQLCGFSSNKALQSVDPPSTQSYIDSCNVFFVGVRVSNEDLKNLEGRIDALIETCKQLKNENNSLKSEKDTLADQHAKLMEKTQTARARIESMIGRLKALERN